MARSLRSASKQPCLCGCGLLTSSDWYPGHDSKAKSRLMDALASGPDAVAALPFAEHADELARRWGLLLADGSPKPRSSGGPKGPRTFLLEHPAITAEVVAQIREMAKTTLGEDEEVAAGLKAASEVIESLLKQAAKKEGVKPAPTIRREPEESSEEGEALQDA